jgi:hypothetical protein
MLTPQQQLELVRGDPTTFVPAKGAWGRRGCTQVLLETVDAATLRNALMLAWTNKAPKKVAARLGRAKSAE